MPTQLCGAGLAFLAFSVSLIIGLWVNNPFVTVVLRALWVLALFYILGCLLSIIGQKVIQENFNKETQALQEKDQDSTNTQQQQEIHGANPKVETVENSSAI